MSLVSPLIDKHPDFEDRIGKLSVQDFLTICERESITVVDSQAHSGFIFWYEEKPFIALRERDAFVCFHELGHYFHGEEENQADTFAELCTGKSR